MNMHGLQLITNMETYSGSLCLAGINQGSCYRINHFPDDNDYDTDSSEYLLRKCFPIYPSHLALLKNVIYRG